MFYTKSIPTLEKEFGVAQKSGLTSSQVKEKQSKVGMNILEQKNKISPWFLFFSQFRSFIIYILIFAVFISVISGEWVDAIVILVILFFNAIFGFIQEYKAGKAIDALQKLAAFKVQVTRNDERILIDAVEIVPGDIIHLDEGARVPADARIIEAKGIQVIESSLTGESVPTSKAETVYKGTVALAEQKNMLFSGTAIARGRATAIVVATGMQTQIGKIAGMISSVEDEETPLQKQLDKLGKKIGIGTIIICIGVFILGALKSLAREFSFEAIRESLLVSVSLAVAAVPEGLPAVVTIALAIGVKKMVGKHALIRKLPSVETLGSATVICSDKTGTITTNQMTVRVGYTNKNSFEVTGNGYDVEGEFTKTPTKEDMLLFEIGQHCNDATLQDNGSRANTIIGDPTEASLLVSALKAGLRAKLSPRIDELPFDSDRKMMSTLHKTTNSYSGTKGNILYTKGAPERILDVCTRIYENGKVVKLTPAKRKSILVLNEHFASKAYRVLGFAYKPIKTKAFAEDDLIFVGLQGMIDPPHKQVKGAIATCKKAGIRVIMITGDNKLTASAIASEVGIEGDAIEGEKFAKMTKQQQLKLLESVGVFARVEPRHKMQIVTLLQEQGHIVAMTGDGVNDAPAIRKANLGIAMGIAGTDVAKEASKMIIQNDNFTSIVDAIREGRGIYQNIKKFVNYLLSCNLGEVFVIFFALLFGWELPMTAIMLLWLNLVTDGLPALALSVDPYGKNLMSQKPQKTNAQIMDKSMGFAIFYVSFLIAGGVLSLFAWARGMYEGDVNQLAHMQTIAFTAIIIMEIVRLQAIRAEYEVGMFENKWLILAVIGSIGLQLLVIYTPLSVFFGTVPLVSADWAAIILVSAVIYILNVIGTKLHDFVEAEKQ